MAEKQDVARISRHAAANILMCPPNYFEVCYRINPWMDPDAWSSQAGMLTALARRQWRQLHDTLVDLGAKLDLVPPVRGLPDMVFTANAAVTA